MHPLPKKLFRLGIIDLPPDALPLRAGPLTALFEPHSAFLRYLRLGDHEILRGIYPAVRNPQWDTIPLQLSALEMDLQEDSFHIRFEADCSSQEIQFHWEGQLEGLPSGQVSYSVRGKATAGFAQNRIGLCILHPILECAGQPCHVESMEGEVQPSAFPKTISPHQPFKNVRALRYSPAPGVTTEIRFGGETFETEDQRNWTDASFKSYAPPLDRPWPSRIEAGTVVNQSVTVCFPTPPRKILPIVQGRSPQLSIATTPVLPMPPLGLVQASHDQPLSAVEVERLKVLHLNHLRSDVWFRDPEWPHRLRQALAQSAVLGLSLHLALHLTEAVSEELSALAQELSASDGRITLCLIHQEGHPTTPEPVLDSVRRWLGSVAPQALLAAGTDNFFVEINRQRPPLGTNALPCYSVEPQVHATDARTMVETLAAQAMTVETLQSFAPRAAVLSPISLKSRPRPALPGSPAPHVLAGVDRRQMSLFGAAWTVGSLARLAATGRLHSLTYFETTGWRGLMETLQGTPRPLDLPDLSGQVFPIYHVFADVAGYHHVYPTHSTHPLDVEGLTMANARQQRRMLVANLSGERQEVRIKSGTGKGLVRYLDESNAEEAMRDPESFQAQAGAEIESASGKLTIHLQPYAVARLDLLS